MEHTHRELLHLFLQQQASPGHLPLFKHPPSQIRPVHLPTQLVQRSVLLLPLAFLRHFHYRFQIINSNYRVDPHLGRLNRLYG
jgi:hypothetical protein